MLVAFVEKSLTDFSGCSAGAVVIYLDAADLSKNFPETNPGELEEAAHQHVYTEIKAFTDKKQAEDDKIFDIEQLV